MFVDKSVKQAFTAKVLERAQNTTIGFDKNQDIVTGPLIDGRAWNRIKGLIDDAAEKGARILLGGDRPADLQKGYFLAPTVLDDVTPEMEIYKDEIFGPVISLIEYEDEQEMVERANDGEDGGLASYIFTSDIGKAEAIASDLRYGEIQINGVKYDIDLPHGGIGQSGIGHDCSHLALNDYLMQKRLSRALL